jgi:oligoribonuclease NrnB/cAMP/cGMP phosphodiesterase (DHH superfamily)
MKETILITLFYHGVDLDGWCSSALIEYFAKHLKEFKGKDIHFRFNEWNYGFKVFDKHYTNSDYIFMTDIVLPEDEMTLLSESLENPENFYVFDHHATQKKIVDSLIKKELINKESVCISDNCATFHVWDWITKKLRGFDSESLENLSAIINLVDLWDTHSYVTMIGKDDSMVQNIKNFKTYVGSVEANVINEDGKEFWHGLFDKALKDEECFYDELETMCTYGNIIESAQIHQLNGIVPNFAFSADFEGYKMLCINSLPSICSNYLNEWEKSKEYDLICTFYFSYRKSEWSFSIRTRDGADENIDLIPLWNKYNKIRAGGHKGAGCIRCKSFEYDFKNQTLELKF